MGELQSYTRQISLKISLPESVLVSISYFHVLGVLSLTINSILLSQRMYISTFFFNLEDYCFVYLVFAFPSSGLSSGIELGPILDDKFWGGGGLVGNWKIITKSCYINSPVKSHYEEPLMAIKNYRVVIFLKLNRRNSIQMGTNSKYFFSPCLSKYSK